MKNIILSTDSYKFSHWLQYPENTTNVWAYGESRGSTLQGVNTVTFFGLQHALLNIFSKPITMEDVEEAHDIATRHGLPFNLEGFTTIATELGGKLPVRIDAVPEGTVTPVNVPLFRITNTDERFYWLPSFLETALLRAVWYPTTVASLSRAIRKMLVKYAIDSGSDVDAVQFKLHDFGARGVSSGESAGIGGLAHLVNFMGTDTVEALVVGKESYFEDMAGYSIPASEHSTMTIFGPDGEPMAYTNMVEKFADAGKLFACVSDSYDIFNAVENIWAGGLLDEVKKRDATVVIRPDSGDPVTTPVEVIKLLMEKVGYTTNERGYRTLPAHVRVIQGDGITIDSIQEILLLMDDEKLSLDNIAFGMGGGLLQQVNRDTFKFAMKTCMAKVDGVYRKVFKDPVTDKGKRSKAGYVDTVLTPTGSIEALVLDSPPTQQHENSIMWTVFENGEVLITERFDTIRKRALVDN